MLISNQEHHYFLRYPFFRMQNMQKFIKIYKIDKKHTSFREEEGGFGREKEVFAVSYSIARALSGTFYGTEKTFFVVKCQPLKNERFSQMYWEFA